MEVQDFNQAIKIPFTNMLLIKHSENGEQLFNVLKTEDETVEIESIEDGGISTIPLETIQESIGEIGLYTLVETGTPMVGDFILGDKQRYHCFDRSNLYINCINRYTKQTCILKGQPIFEGEKMVFATFKVYTKTERLMNV